MKLCFLVSTCLWVVKQNICGMCWAGNRASARNLHGKGAKRDYSNFCDPRDSKQPEKYSGGSFQNVLQIECGKCYVMFTYSKQKMAKWWTRFDLNICFKWVSKTPPTIRVLFYDKHLCFQNCLYCQFANNDAISSASQDYDLLPFSNPGPNQKSCNKCGLIWPQRTANRASKVI